MKKRATALLLALLMILPMAGLGVRAQVRHRGRVAAAYVGEYLKKLVREVEGERHIFFRVAAGVAEHHSLVAGALLGEFCALDSAVDVVALFVYRADNAAGRCVKAVFGLGVAYAAYDLAGGFLDIDVGVA